MAEGILFNMIEKLIGKLGSVVVQCWNMRDDLDKLVENMSEIKAVVLDAEEQQGTNNHQVQLWLENLKDAFDDADDFLDYFNTEELRRQVMTNHKKAKKVRIFFSSSNQLLFSYKMVQKIKELSKRIEALNVDKRVFNFTNRAPEQRVLRERETHSFISAEDVIGRDEEKKELIELLFNTSNNVKENVSVISIIGIGGLGKTALAQFVYNDKKVQEHFEFKKWVCVSDDFDVKGIAAKIIKSNTTAEMEEVQLELRNKVKGKRYLLVLDDNWNENRNLWLELMILLKDGAEGSKIIITARSEMVAKASGSSSILFLKGLSEKQSWTLFSQLAFENDRELENEELVSIGKEIVKKCAGVPLAIRSIGSLMYFKEKEDWSTFKNKDLMQIDEQGDKILQLIKLSYDHLPFHLKKCFAFCSLFPKDYFIPKTTLIRLWIAQGFVQSSDDESTSLEDIGHMYFMDLVYKSFFQNITEDNFYGSVSCQMHDIMHDLASVISRNDCLLVNKKGQHIDKQPRHVSFGFQLNHSWQVPTSLLNAYKLRTFLLPLKWVNSMNGCDRCSIELCACNSILASSRRFRVLNLSFLNLTNIPSCIGRMKQLRYLDLSCCFMVEELPRSITELVNLETLLLNRCSKLRELPKDLWKLVSLRHLELDYCHNLTSMPRGIGKMTNLQTLTQFVLDTTSKDSAKTSELGGLHNLRGLLEITGLEHLRHCPTEAKPMNLRGKSHLDWLALNWKEDNVGDANELEKDEIILQDILLHSNIKTLIISGFGGVKLSNSVNLLTNLVDLNLYNCTRLQYIQLAPLHVKDLYMRNLPCLEYIVNDSNSDNSSSSCASLTDIVLILLTNLKGWCKCSEEEISRGCCHQFQSLKRLSISGCCNLVSIPQHKHIREVILREVRETILQQAVNHSKVEYLQINSILNLKSLCGVFQHLSTLYELYITNCKEFDPCNDEDGCYSMKWKELSNLKMLTFKDIPKMKYLPEGLQHITTLQTLRIWSCENLTSIPEWVKSLQVFDIEGGKSIRLLSCPFFNDDRRIITTQVKAPTQA
ncbi:putative P-loop containing nucleoside triphosphate hydrolase, leucine-rich repeat domain, L [Medicago truncatula]|uniref:NBS-LRR type disease resistance protein n=1 Tax=Medicago truncatula TaxID=3880 RepID=G7JUL2_MEDTR|nr:putative disease resistance protein RGA1 [Medicago truncatula]AES87186.1 NBS-LRR type disease resistance protein [Medicago truncatula]RHN59161.1 putative P-loop containing nucleoside triphosphate hydrolase, leucine-rich repeat domain, L [Medicago truncatula]